MINLDNGLQALLDRIDFVRDYEKNPEARLKMLLDLEVELRCWDDELKVHAYARILAEPQLLPSSLANYHSLTT